MSKKIIKAEIEFEIDDATGNVSIPEADKLNRLMEVNTKFIRKAKGILKNRRNITVVDLLIGAIDGEDPKEIGYFMSTMTSDTLFEKFIAPILKLEALKKGMEAAKNYDCFHCPSYDECELPDKREKSILTPANCGKVSREEIDMLMPVYKETDSCPFATTDGMPCINKECGGLSYENCNQCSLSARYRENSL